MSSSLHWRPPNPEGDYLGYDIKFVLREYCGASYVDELTLGRGDVPFLKGVLAGTSNKELKDDVKKVLALIKQHGEIVVFEVN